MNTPLILVVDDDLPFLWLMSEVLQGEGYQTELCAEPDEVFALIELHQPNLLILDIRFSHQNLGFEILRQLRAAPSTQALPVIICSVEARLLASDGSRLQDQRCAYLTKPFELEDLLETVQRLLATA